MRVCLTVALLLLASLAHARQLPVPQTPTVAMPPAPKTLVLLTSELTWDDLRPNGDLIPLRRLASEGGCALLNAAVSGEPTDAAAFLTVGAGDRMAAPDERGPHVAVDQVSLSVADIAEEAYPATAWEGNAVRPVYVRRFGVPAPDDAVAVDIGLPLLRRAQAGPASAARLGALGDALTAAGRRVAVFGDWRAVVVAMDRRGAVYHGSGVLPLTPTHLPAALEEADVVVASVPPGLRPLRILCNAVLPLVGRGELNLIVACPAPPVDSARGRWRRLGFVVAAGPAFPPHTLLTSATTRTKGLVANVDLADTVLAAQGLPPLPGSAGHPIRAVAAGRQPLDAVAALDARVTLADEAAVPVLVGCAAFALAAGLAALVAVCLDSRRGAPSGAGKPAAFLLRLAAAGPLAFLPAGLLDPQHVWEYGVVFAALALVLTLLADLVAGWLETSSLALLFLGTAAAVGIDALFGSPVVSLALPSGYYLPGLRFYGVGDGYMALTIGMTLAGLAMAAPRQALAPAGAAVALLLGLPWLGANPGGAFAAGAACLLAALPLRSPEASPHPRVRDVVLAFAGGLLLAGIGVAAAAHDGIATSPDTALELLARHAARALHASRSGWTLSALAGLIPAGLLLLRSGSLREAVSAALTADPALARMLTAALWGAVAALNVADSGLAAALLLLAPPAVAVLHRMTEGG